MDNTSDSENKIGRGTTIIAYIYGDTIYIVSDGRRSSTTQDIFLVLQGDDKKIYKITDKICATTAGGVSLCDEMLEIAQKEGQSSQDFHKMGTKLKKHREKYMKDKIKESMKNKKKNKVKSVFEAQFGLHSVDGMNGRPYIQLIGFMDIDAYTDGDIVASGTGGDAAKKHFMRRMKHSPPQTPLEILSYMKLSVVESGFGDIYTGGFIQEAILSQDGLFIRKENDHMIRHLADHYQEFSDILKTKLLCISRKFAYKVENEEVVTELITDQFSAFPTGSPKELLLGVHAHNLIVRCVSFIDEATTKDAFNSLGRGPLVPVRLNSGVYKVEFKKPTRNEFIQLAREFVDKKDF